MIDDLSTGYVVGGAGILLAIGREAWSRFFSPESKAEGLLVQQLTERIASQEQRLLTLESGLDTERAMRRAAELRVQALEVYIVMLKAELRRNGIEVPAHQGAAE